MRMEGGGEGKTEAEEHWKQKDGERQRAVSGRNDREHCAGSAACKSEVTAAVW